MQFNIVAQSSVVNLSHYTDYLKRNEPLGLHKEILMNAIIGFNKLSSCIA
jgi:hypothetical protein